MSSSFASCCLLSYNRPAYLKKAVTTLLDHAEAPLELIVHDDGSSDRELAHLLQGYVEHGVISTLITNPPGHNQGQGVALNRMFSIARGDPIIKLDQDLVFRPGWLRRVNEILAANTARSGPDAGGFREPEIGLLGLFHYHHPPVDSEATLIRLQAGWQQHTHICGSGFAVRRQAWAELGPFVEHAPDFSEDWAFQKRVTESGRYVCALPDDDLVVNEGFGIGPSTVALSEDRVQPIKKEPLLHA